jgi:hypothetical protein
MRRHHVPPQLAGYLSAHPGLVGVRRRGWISYYHSGTILARLAGEQPEIHCPKVVSRLRDRLYAAHQSCDCLRDACLLWMAISWFPGPGRDFMEKG